MGEYANKNASEVLNRVNARLEELQKIQGKERSEINNVNNRYIRKSYSPARWAYSMNAVYDELSIFDWWNDTLSISNLEDMKAFLQIAIKLGYTGYACFKVGATGCANGMWVGMWVSKNESTTGYSPDGECIYRSFTPDYVNWSYCDKDNKWSKSMKLRELQKELKEKKKF